MTKLNVTTYNTVAANTVADAVIDAPSILAWRQNIKDVVDGNSPDGQYAVDAGSTDAYAVTLSPVPSAYYTGMVIRFKANTANTGACSLNANSLGTVAIKKKHDQDLKDNDIESGQIVEVVHDGTNFQMLSPTANNVQESWTAPTLQNSWVNFGSGRASVGYYKDDFNKVTLRGTIKSGTLSGAVPAFSLPTGYRPLSTQVFNLASNSGSAMVGARLVIASTGDCFIDYGSNVELSLDGVVFRGEQ